MSGQGSRGLARLLPKRLRTKIIAWAFVPTAIILAGVALLNFYAYQQVTEELVVERNQDVTRLSAGQLVTHLNEYTDVLDSVARTAANYPDDVGAQRDVLRQARNRLAVFDGGALLLDPFGRVVAVEPDRPEALNQDWSDRDYYRQIVQHQISESPAPVFSDIVPDGPGGLDALVVAVPVKGQQEEFLGALLGMFQVGPAFTSALYGDIVDTRVGKSGDLYVLDGSGRVIYHTNREYISGDLSDQDVARLVLNGQIGAIRTRDFENKDIVAAFAPVPGTGWGLVTEESWAGLTRGSRDYQRFLILMLLAGIVVPALVVAVGVRRMMRPITDLIAAAQRVAQGDFGQPIAAQTEDEIGELAQQFNLMSAQLRTTYASLEQRVMDRTKELAALNAIATVVSRALDLHEVLGDALDETMRVTGLEAAGIYLLQPDGTTLTLTACEGLDPELAEQIDNLQSDEGLSGQVVRTGEPVVVKDLVGDARITRTMVQLGDFHAAAVVPLVSRGNVLGTLFVMAREYRAFAREDMDLLTSIGRQVGVTVENAQLYAQAQQAAALEERQRLARELHDAVTQTLFSATLIAEVLPRIWERNQQQGRQRLVELHELTKGALAEMRALLLELRPNVLAEAELSDLLQQLADSITGRARVPVRLHIEGETELTPEVKVALYRIAQEALNNIAKHAAASQATVSLSCENGALKLQVSDDGQGFDPGSIAPERLGVGIMRERAANIGAELSIESRAGHGTCLTVIWRGA